jgi:hypothetical protein
LEELAALLNNIVWRVYLQEKAKIRSKYMICLREVVLSPVESIATGEGGAEYDIGS